MFNLEKRNNIYKAVEDAAKELAGKRLDISRDGKEIYVSWLSYVEYVEGSGIVKVEFHRSLKPYLLQLQEYGNFTKFQMNHVVSFKSQYSIRIYELLKAEAFKAKQGKFNRYFRLEDFRLILGIAKNEYDVFSNLRRKVIDPAVEEVSEHTDLEIEEVRYGRIGRKITDITFVVKIRTVDELPTLQLEMTEEPPKEQAHPIIERLVSLGYGVETAQRDLKKYGVKRLERNIAYTLAKQQEGVVKDIPAYLNMAIKEDMGGGWEVVKTKAAEEKTQQQAVSTQREKQAELAHLQKMAEMAGVPLETLLPKKGGSALPR